MSFPWKDVQEQLANASVKIVNSSLHDDVVSLSLSLKVVSKSYVQCIRILGSLSNHEEDGNKDVHITNLHI